MKHPGPVFPYPPDLLRKESSFYTVLFPVDLFEKALEKSSLALDPNRVSSLLPGEPVTIVEERGSFVSVSAWWQPRWHIERERFEPYQGWIRRESLEPLDREREWRQIVSCPTHFVPELPVGALYIDLQENSLLEKAQLLVEGEPLFVDKKETTEWGKNEDPILQFFGSAGGLVGLSYVLGGLRTDSRKESCSPLEPGLDCSGLAHLSARCSGSVVPRDSKDQYRFLRSKACSKEDRGKLVFLLKNEQVYHLVLEPNPKQWLESSRAYGGVILHPKNSRVIDPADRIESVCVSSLFC